MFGAKQNRKLFLVVRLTEAERRAVESIAEKQGQDLSEVTRAALGDYVKKQLDGARDEVFRSVERHIIENGGEL